MRDLTVTPEKPGAVQLRSIPEPSAAQGAVLTQTLAIGVCGMDREIVEGMYGQAPEGADWLILGHESPGLVLEAPADSGLTPGDLVVGIVHRSDPVPCPNCAAGEWDMCRNGLYTECGITQRHGFGQERFRTEPEFAVRVDPALGPLGVLLEPVSVLAKAWEHVERIGTRAHWQPRRALVTRAGPVGLLAALLGVQRGLEVHVLGRVTEGPKPGLVRALGATCHTSSVREAGEGADVVLECTGVIALTGNNGNSFNCSGISWNGYICSVSNLRSRRNGRSNMLAKR